MTRKGQKVRNIDQTSCFYYWFYYWRVVATM